MAFAKLLKEDEDGYIVLMNEKDYEAYVEELQKWLNENQENVIDNSKEKKIKKIILTEDKI